MHHDGDIFPVSIISLPQHEILLSLSKNDLQICHLNSGLQLYTCAFTDVTIPPELRATYKTKENLYSFLRSQELALWSVECFESMSKIRLKPLKYDIHASQVTKPQEIMRLTLSVCVQTKKYLNDEISTVRKECKVDIEKRISKVDYSLQDIEANHRLFTKQLQGVRSAMQQSAQNWEKAIREQTVLMQERLKEVEERLLEENFRLNQQQDVIKEQLERKMQQDYNLINEQIAQISQSLPSLKHHINSQAISLKDKFEQLTQQLLKYDMEEINAKITQIQEAFQLQLRVKEYELVIVKPISIQPICIRNNFIKSQADVRDYIKIQIGKDPFSIGKSVFRLLAGNIKSNGLIVGVYSETASIETAQYNDKGLIWLNSCGYIMNKGRLIPKEFKVQKGQVVKVIVDTHFGWVRWIVDEAEIASVELGVMNAGKIYPFVGLGYINDEVEILSQAGKDRHIEFNEYSKQVERLNRLSRPNHVHF